MVTYQLALRLKLSVYLHIQHRSKSQSTPLLANKLPVYFGLLELLEQLVIHRQPYIHRSLFEQQDLDRSLILTDALFRAHSLSPCNKDHIRME